MEAKIEDAIVSDDVESLSQLIHHCDINDTYLFLKLLIKAINSKSHEALSYLIEFSKVDLFKPVNIDGCQKEAQNLEDSYACQMLIALGCSPLVCYQKCVHKDDSISFSNCEDPFTYSFKCTSQTEDFKLVRKLFWAYWYLNSHTCSSKKLNDSFDCLKFGVARTCIFRRICSHKPSSRSDLSSYINKTPQSDILKKENSVWSSLGKRLFSFASEKTTQVISNCINNDWLTNKSSYNDINKILDRFSENNLPENLEDFLDWSHYRLSTIFYDCSCQGSKDVMEFFLDRGFYPTILHGKFGKNCPFDSFLQTDSSTKLIHIEESHLPVTILVEQNTYIIQLQLQGEYEFYLSDIIASKIGSMLNKQGIANFGDTAVHAICRNGHIDCLQSVLKKIPMACQINSMAESVHLDPVDGTMLIDSSNRTTSILPIHTAACAGQMNCLKELLNMPKYLSNKLQQELPTHSCVLNGLPAIYFYPFCIDQLDEHGLTPFLLAVLHGHLDCVEILTSFHVRAERVEPDQVLEATETHSIDKAEEADFLGNGLLETLKEEFMSPGVSEEATEEFGEIDNVDDEDQNENWCQTITSNVATAVISHSTGVCPIDLTRRLYLSWDPQSAKIIITPLEHPILNLINGSSNFTVCGYFGALHISVMRRDLEMVCYLLNYLNGVISEPGLPCIHEHGEVDENSLYSLLKSSTMGISYLPEEMRSKANVSETAMRQMLMLDRIIATTPLGLACTLREAQLSTQNFDNTILQIIRILLIAGAKDYHNILFKQACVHKDFDLIACLLSARSVSQGVTIINDQKQNCDQSLSVDWSEADLDFANKMALIRDIDQETSCDINFRTWLDESCWFGEVKSMMEGPISNFPLEVISDLLTKPIGNQSSLNSLTKLNLSYCNLKSIPLCIFTRLPRIQTLDVSSNIIDYLPDNLPFDELSSCVGSNSLTVWCTDLAFFDLSDNKLRQIPIWLFDNTLAVSSSSSKNSIPLVRFAPYLGTLILAGNCLRVLPKQMWFNRTITYLDISRNSLTCLPTITMNQLLKANFSNNKRNRNISFSRRDKFNGVLDNMKDCSNSSNDDFSLPREHELIPCPEDHIKCLYGNEIFLSLQIDSQAFSSKKENYIECANLNVPSFLNSSSKKWFGGLLHLYIQHNQLSDLPLDSIMNSFVSIGSKEITTANSSSVNTVEHEILPGLHLLAPNLISLDVSNNRIEPFGVPKDYPKNLACCDFANNRITHLGLIDHSKIIAAGKLENLMLLNLRGNKIKFFQPVNNSVEKEFNESINVTEISLETPNVPQPSHTMKTGCKASDQERKRRINCLWFPNLSKLDLSDNSELVFIDNAISYMNRLATLELENCVNLSELPPALWQLENLRILSINGTLVYQQLSTVLDGKSSEEPKSKRSVSKHSDFTAINGLHTKDILAYLKAASNKNQAYNKMRLIIVGSPKSGKTSLLQALRTIEMSSHNKIKVVRKSGGNGGSSKDDDSRKIDVMEPKIHHLLSVELLRIQRPAPSSLKIPQNKKKTQSVYNRLQEISNWAETIDFFAWDFSDNYNAIDEYKDLISYQQHANTISAIQQYSFTKGSIFLLVWNMAEGLKSLDQMSRWMVNIFCRATQAPIIIVGTHADKCPTEDAPQHGLFTVPTLLDMVHRRYFQICLDPTSYGIPSIQAQVHLAIPNVTLLSTLFDISNTDDSIIQIRNLATLIHKTANSLRISGRLTATFLGHASGKIPIAMRFLGLPVPILFHELEKITIQLTNEMHSKNIIPIMQLDQYLTEICNRLSQLHPNQQEGRSLFDKHKEARAAVAFLHEVGCVMHFSSPALHNVIFLDPVWLFRFFLRLLVLSPTEKSRNLAVTGHKSPLRAGVLPTSLMVHLLSTDSTPCGFTINQLTQILVNVLSKYELAVPLNKDNLLVPAMLPLEQQTIEANIDPRIVDTSLSSESIERQIRIIPTDLMGTSALDNDCAIFTLPRKSGTRPIMRIESAQEQSVAAAFSRFHPSRQPLKKASMLSSKIILPDWEAISVCENELVRIYAMSYIPAGFWTRLITRLLSDPTLDILCRRLYNLGNLPKIFLNSLLCFENPLQLEHIKSGNKNGLYGSDNLEINELLPGWSVWQSGLHLTLAGGRIKVMSLKQATESCTAALQFAKRQLATASELVFLESDSFIGSKIDYRQRNGRRLELNPETKEIIPKPYTGLQTDCILELVFPSLAIRWPHSLNFAQSPIDCSQKIENESPDLIIHPNKLAIAQMFTKVLQHIDSLLEDWYPDLGCQFRQSTEGNYLITRFIPCSSCMALCPGEMDYLETNSNQDSSEEADENVSGSANKSIKFYDMNLPDPTIQDDISKSPSKSNQSTFSNTRRYSGKNVKIHAGSASLELSCGKIEDLLLFGVTVEEYVHWLLICGDNSRRTEKVRRLCCPMHPNVEFKAPDLNFEDLSTDLLPHIENVSLEKFLGRGSFGTVFHGSLFKRHLNFKYKSPCSLSLDDQYDLSDVLNLPEARPILPLGDLDREISVAIKIGSPIDPFVARKPICLAETDLEGSSQNKKSEEGTLKAFEAPHDAPSPWDDDFQTIPQGEDAGLGDMREAQVYYRQHLKRWQADPVETCFRAYHEMRLELNVLMRIAHWDLGEPVIDNDLLKMNTRSLLTFVGVVQPRPLGIIMPLAPRGSLSDWIRELNRSVQESLLKQLPNHQMMHPIHPITLCLLMFQLSSALAHLHSLRIVHRDIKSDNVLVWDLPDPTVYSSGVQSASHFSNTQITDPRTVRVYITDYGVSRSIALLDGCRGFVGTHGYIAPELLEYQGDETYTEKIDIYSLGIVMSEILKLSQPYEQLAGSIRFNLAQFIVSGGRPQLSTFELSRCPEVLTRLIAQCLSSEATERPSAQKLFEILSQSAWLQRSISTGEYQRSQQSLLARALPNTLGRASSVFSSRASVIRASSKINRTSSHRKSILNINRPIKEPTENISHNRPTKHSYFDNGISRIESVLRIDGIDVVTCAIIDSSSRIWLGGYSEPASGSPCACKIASSLGTAVCRQHMAELNFTSSHNRQGALLVITFGLNNIQDNTQLLGSKCNKNSLWERRCYTLCSWPAFFFSCSILQDEEKKVSNLSSPSSPIPPNSIPFTKEGWPLILSVSYNQPNPKVSSDEKSISAPEMRIVWCIDSNFYLHAFDVRLLQRLASINLYQKPLSIEGSITFQSYSEISVICGINNVFSPGSKGDSFGTIFNCFIGTSCGNCGIASITLSHINKLSSSKQGDHPLRCKNPDSFLITNSSRISINWTPGILDQLSPNRSISAIDINTPTTPKTIWIGLSGPKILICRWSTRVLMSSSASTIDFSTDPQDSVAKDRKISVGSLTNTNGLVKIKIMDTLDLRNALRPSMVTHLCSESAFFANGLDWKPDRRVWSYLYPDNIIHCWSANTKTQLRSISLNSLIPMTVYNLDFNTNCEIFPYAKLPLAKNLGYITHMSYIEGGGLYVGTSSGHLVRSQWPVMLVQMRTQQPIKSWLMPLHQMATEKHYCTLIGQLRNNQDTIHENCYDQTLRLVSIGNGFLDPLSCIQMPNKRDSKLTEKACIVTMFDDEFYNP